MFFFICSVSPTPGPWGMISKQIGNLLKKEGRKRGKKEEKEKISKFWEACFKSGMGRLSKSMKQYTPLVLGKDLISNKKVDHISQQFLYLVIVMDVF